MVKTPIRPNDDDNWATDLQGKIGILFTALAGARNVVALGLPPDDWDIHLNLRNNAQFAEAIELVEKWGAQISSFAITSNSRLWVDLEIKFKNKTSAMGCRAWLMMYKDAEGECDE